MIKNLQDLESQITEIYQDFYKKMNIDSSTGLMSHKGKEYQFVTMPHIGSRYVDANIKILFIGMDMGMKETENIQDFEERRGSVVGNGFTDLNPHIAGTYATALYFLRGTNDSLEKVAQELLESDKPIQTALKQMPGLPIDLLEYVALTNFYKFITAGSTKRSTASGRKMPDQCHELLVKEIKLLDPEIVIMQGTNFRNFAITKTLQEMGKKVFIAYHPSYRGEKALAKYLGKMVPNPLA